MTPHHTDKLLHLYMFVTWYGILIADVLLVCVLLIKRRAGSFPIFTAWVASDALTLILLIYAGSHFQRLTFRNISLTTNIASQAIQLLVVYEIAMHVFRPTGQWARDVYKPLIAIAGAGILLASLFAFLAHPAFANPLQSMLWRANLFYSVLMTQIFAGMVVLSSTAGLPWKTHAARIAQGFGATSLLYLPMQVAACSVNSVRLHKIYVPLSLAGQTFLLAADLYWLVMMWRDAPEPQELPETVRMQIYTLHQHLENDLLKIRSWKSR